MLYQLTNKSDP